MSLFSCGLEEAYYLPQVSQGLISSSINTADINIPFIDPDDYRYANNYAIFYRIYISGQDISGTITSPSERNSISSDLERDFSAISPNTDPTNTAEVSTSLFSTRNYFELELDGTNIKNLLSTAGGALRLDFPTAQGGIPVAEFNENGNEIRLSRSTKGNQGSINNLEPDQFFLNTSELNDRIDTASNTNIDVAGRTVSPQFAYVSMYITLVGLNPTTFSPILGKPTHIGIFKLPNAN